MIKCYIIIIYLIAIYVDTWNIKIKQIKKFFFHKRPLRIIKEKQVGFRGTVTSVLWICIMCWEAWFYSILISLYPFSSWTLLLDMIPAHWEVCVLSQHLPLEFATYLPTLRLSWAGLWVPVRSEELEKAIGESKDANGSSQLSKTKEERERKIH